MNKSLIYIAAMATTAAWSCSSHNIKYPAAPTDTSVTDTYFDTIVADPYRPLENDTAEVTLAWVKEENKITNDYLSAIPFRNDIKNRLQELINYPRRGSYWRDNDGKYYYYENDGLQNQSILYRTDSIGKPGELFLDPNKLSDDGTVALTGTNQSRDGKYTAYTISRNGSDWTEIYVMDTATGNLLPDHIEWAKFTGAQWCGDGFYYSAYPRPEKGKEFSNANENHQIYYHKLGTPQSADHLIYQDPAHPLHFHSAYVTDNEDYLMVIGSGEGFGESLMIKDLKKPGAQWKIVEPTQDIELSPLGVFDGKLYLLTNYGAERYQIVTADVNNPGRENWQTLIPEQDAVIKGVSFTPDNMIISYEKDATNHVYLYDMKGNLVREIQLPGIGSAGFWSSDKYPDIFYTFTSFTSPAAVYAYDAATDNSHLLWSPDIKGVDMTDYETRQVWITSADGTKLPMFITYKKGLDLNGKNPTLLYGYGGFNISLTPGFSAMRMLWLENGGVYAMANLRGGGEYGESWHKAGTKMQKLNVFNDFIACAEYLIEQKYTSPDYLAIQGGSNGGLLVGAVTNMRPDLFKVAIPQVGVMDMMRYHLFTIGWNWASDYGTSADSKEMADYLLAYSPVHNIKNDGTPYPAILITTADHDDRVVPAHSFKYAATLQAADTGDAPKLIRIESNAGHGAGKPISKSIEESADIYSFILYNMGITPDIKK